MLLAREEPGEPGLARTEALLNIGLDKIVRTAQKVEAAVEQAEQQDADEDAALGNMPVADQNATEVDPDVAAARSALSTDTVTPLQVSLIACATNALAAAPTLSSRNVAPVASARGGAPAGRPASSRRAGASAARATPCALWHLQTRNMKLPYA